jgi:hypothetical protein
MARQIETRIQITLPTILEYAMDNHYHTDVTDNAFYGDPDYPWDAYIQS